MQRKLTLSEMMDIQEELNIVIDPDWAQKRTFGELDVAILDELSEYLGSGRKWKWWKKAGNPNVWNEKLEIIDALHFYISKMILSHRERPYTVEELDNTVGYSISDSLAPVHNEDGSLNHRIFMYAAKVLLSMDVGLEKFNHILTTFNISAEEFAAIYVAKATLNEIRQRTGYQDGSYRKVVGGVEDNDRLRDIVAAFVSDRNLTLSDVKKMVEKEFYGPVDDK